MLHLTETWKNAINQGEIIGVLFIDFKKAFDLVCHQTLALKLQACGISGNLHKLLMSYLQNRKQFVEINGKSSDSCEVKYGVPQGSLLGPRLFGIQVADLPEVPSEGVLEMFANDTEYYYTGNSVDEVTLIIQKSFNKINEWCMKNLINPP